MLSISDEKEHENGFFFTIHNFYSPSNKEAAFPYFLYFFPKGMQKKKSSTKQRAS